MNRLRAQLTYSNVISTLCLVLLLGGGTAYAASQLEKESVGAKQLKKEAVTPAKLSKASKATLTGPTAGRPAPTGADGRDRRRRAQGPKGDAGVKGDRGEVGPRGPSDGYYAFNNDTALTSKTLTLSVPAGTYVASGSMYTVLTSGYDEIGCSLKGSAASANEGRTALTIGPPSGASIVYAHPQVEAGLEIGPGGGTITLTCAKFGNGTGTPEFYQARIVATRVETLTTIE